MGGCGSLGTQAAGALTAIGAACEEIGGKLEGVGATVEVVPAG